MFMYVYLFYRIFSFGVKFVSLHLEVGEFSDNEIIPVIASSIEIKDISAASDHVQFGQLMKCALELKVKNLLLNVLCEFLF